MNVLQLTRIIAKKYSFNYYFLQETEGQQISEQKYLERLKNEDFGSSFVGKMRKHLWNLTEYPETSLAARVRK